MWQNNQRIFVIDGKIVFQNIFYVWVLLIFELKNTLYG